MHPIGHFDDTPLMLPLLADHSIGTLAAKVDESPILSRVGVGRAVDAVVSPHKSIREYFCDHR